MIWTDIATASYRSPEGLVRSVRLAVRETTIASVTRTGDESPDGPIWASFDGLPASTAVGQPVALASGGAATVEGAALTSTPGASGTGARFAGAARLALPAPVTSADYAISFRIRRDEIAAPQTYKSIISAGGGGEAHHILLQGWALTTYADDRGGFSSTSVYTVPNDGAFHHVVLSVAAGVGTWTVDGVQRATISNPPVLATRPITHIGGSGSPAVTYPAGALDEVRIYPRALTAAEIATLFQYPGGALPATLARVVADAGFSHRAGQPDAHVLADHAPTVVECSLLGPAAGVLSGRADADVRLDVLGSAGRLLYRGNVRVEDVRPAFGMGTPPLRLFAYDGVERLASIPYVAGPDTALAGTRTLAETAALLLAPLGHEIPVATLLGWEHSGQRTDVARARSIRADVGRWGGSSKTPTYRDALRAFLVALDAQLVQHVAPATAPGGGGAVWLVVQRSVRTEALRLGTSILTAAWVAPGGAVMDVAASALGLATATATAVVSGPSVPRPWTPVRRVVSRHASAQGNLRDETLLEVVAGTNRPRWWNGVKQATGALQPAEIVQYAGEGERGVFLGFGVGSPDAILQQTDRSYPAGTVLDIRIKKRTGALRRTGDKTRLNFGVVRAVTPGQPDLYLDGRPGSGAYWSTTYAGVQEDVATPATTPPTATFSGPVECRLTALALPRGAQIEVLILGHEGAESSALAVSASVAPQSGAVEVLGIEAAWPAAAQSASGDTRGADVLVDEVPVGDSTSTTRGTAALEVQASGGAWTPAGGSWRARPAGAAGLGFAAARVVDVAEQAAAALAGVDVVVPRVSVGAPSGLSALPWAGWLDWDGARRLPVCVETDLVRGTVRTVAYPLASGSPPSSAVVSYRYSRDGSVGPVEPAAPGSAP